jgi:hypothetical protein
MPQLKHRSGENLNNKRRIRTEYFAAIDKY